MITTIDSLLVKFVNKHTTELDAALASRDSNVLKSLANAILSPYFITESQSRLLVKILHDNAKKLPELELEITNALAAPLWSKKFRQVEQVRRLYITHNQEGEMLLAIEFTFSAHIRKIINGLTKEVEGLHAPGTGKLYLAAYTEKNIVCLVNMLKPLSFIVDDIILTHYDTIQSWSEDDIKNQFLITSMTNTNFQKHITLDLGISTAIDQNIIHDRSMRYQYFTETQKNHGDSLSEYIANRTRTKIWIDKTQHTLSEVIASLIELKRLPILVVFDSFQPAQAHASLQVLNHALEENGIYEGVGIYFRLPNDDSGKKFNQLVADQRYNQYLGSDTKIAGVQSGKLPKFFLTNDWKPMAVISIDTSLRHSKTAVYASRSDLVIAYSDTETLFETRNIWE